MFKPKSDAMNVGQQIIKIPCRNGLLFQQDQEVVFDVPRNVGFADLANAYVEVDVSIGQPNQETLNQTMPLLQPDRVTGCQSMINTMRVISESGRKIEELYPYNVAAQLHYNATEDEGVLAKRTRMEGCATSYQVLDSPWCVPNRPVLSNADPQAAAAPADPADPIGVIATANDSAQQVTRKVCLPLLGGMFQATRSFPCLAVPFSVSILLEKATRCLRLTGESEVVPLDNVAGAVDVFYVAARAKYSGISGGLAIQDITDIVEGEESINKACNFPFRVGQHVQFVGTNSATVSRVITHIGVVNATGTDGAGANAGSIQVKVGAVGGGVGNGTTGASGDGTLQMYATNRNGNGALLSGTAGYTWNNPRLVIPKVVPPAATVQAISRAIAQGKFSMDIISHTCYQNAIAAGITASANIIPAELTRAKSIVSAPVVQSELDLLRNSNALCSQYLDANQYQYSINNQLRPDRRVDLSREQYPTLVPVPTDEIQRPYQYGKYIGAFHLHECEKTLVSSNIRPRNLKFITLTESTADRPLGTATASPSARSGSWFVGRALGAGPGTSENLVTKAVILYLDYRTNTDNKLLYNFVYHVRTIAVGMNGTQIFY